MRMENYFNCEQINLFYFFTKKEKVLDQEDDEILKYDI